MHDSTSRALAAVAACHLALAEAAREKMRRLSADADVDPDRPRAVPPTEDDRVWPDWPLPRHATQ